MQALVALLNMQGRTANVRARMGGQCSVCILDWQNTHKILRPVWLIINILRLSLLTWNYIKLYTGLKIPLNTICSFPNSVNDERDARASRGVSQLWLRQMSGYALDSSSRRYPRRGSSSRSAPCHRRYCPVFQHFFSLLNLFRICTYFSILRAWAHS